MTEQTPQIATPGVEDEDGQDQGLEDVGCLLMLLLAVLFLAGLIVGSGALDGGW